MVSLRCALVLAFVLCLRALGLVLFFELAPGEESKRSFSLCVFKSDNPKMKNVLSEYSKRKGLGRTPTVPS